MTATPKPLPNPFTTDLKLNGGVLYEGDRFIARCGSDVTKSEQAYLVTAVNAHASQVAQLDAAKERERGLREALQIHGRHLIHCAKINVFGSECDCGYAAALRQGD